MSFSEPAGSENNKPMRLPEPHPDATGRRAQKKTSAENSRGHSIFIRNVVELKWLSCWQVEPAELQLRVLV